MEASTARGEAVLSAVAFSAERSLRGDGDTAGRLRVLAHLGSAAGADRAYLFQNVRDPQGRLWMDSPRGMERLLGSPRSSTIPATTCILTRRRSPGASTSTGAVTCSPSPCERYQTPSAPSSRPRGCSTLTVPVFVREEWWGYVGFDDCTRERAWSEAEIDAMRAVAGNLSVFFDHELAERTQALEEDRYRSMIEHGPAVSYIDATDENASTIYISPQIETVLGYSPAEWIEDEELWPKLLHPDDRARAIAENERHNETGEAFRMEYRLSSRRPLSCGCTMRPGWCVTTAVCRASPTA